MKLKDITLDDFERIEINERVRVYYHELWHVQGFRFIVVEAISTEHDDWFCPESEIEIIMEGRALFDGIRHLYYGSENSDNYGYHYYPDVEGLIKVLEALKRLEYKYCDKD